MSDKLTEAERVELEQCEAIISAAMANINDLRTTLCEFKERQGWRALGYGTWQEYVNNNIPVEFRKWIL